MTKSKHELANITISILVDFDKKIAIFNFDFKIVTALICAIGKLLYSSSTWWVIVAQYNKSQHTIVNNSTEDRDRHIFFLTETQSLPCIYQLVTISIILNSWIAFGSNRMLKSYSIQSEILNIGTALF